MITSSYNIRTSRYTCLSTTSRSQTIQPPESKHKRSHRPVAHTASAIQNTNRELTDTDPLAQIRQLPDLKPEEASLTLLADNWIRIKARTLSKTVQYEALGLANHHKKH